MGTNLKLYIYGAGGLGREVYEVAARYNELHRKWIEIIFIDDFEGEGEFFGCIRINYSSLPSEENREFVVAVGEPSSRKKLYDKLIEDRESLHTLIDPTAIVSKSANLGIGSIVLENSLVKANVTIGANVLIQPFCDIGHDIILGDHTVMSPFSAPGGNSRIGQCVFFGMHAACIQNIKIGDEAVIGMGSVVFRDVSDGSTVLGNPARPTRGNESSKVFTP